MVKSIPTETEVYKSSEWIQKTLKYILSKIKWQQVDVSFLFSLWDLTLRGRKISLMSLVEVADVEYGSPC